MANIVVKPNCENSPKMTLLKEFTIAFVDFNIPFIMEHIDKNVQWNLVGEDIINGKKDFEAFLEKTKESKIKELNIEHIITHGKAASVNGALITENNEKFAFCDVYEFTSASGKLIKKMTSYVIKE